ncbi:Hypothetical predicted protein [Paramuricea clavata]|uniref:Uncharacterized protein n=1 Tax=Paramuricea clavata TaxID=317549 RepID=A0A6S7HSZ7_PARCT|nr:Hypothetical predicted protein [Paramuricea clavata]
MRQGSRHKLCATSINHATLCHGVTFGTQCAQILVDIPSLKPKVFRFSFITISTKTKAIVQQVGSFWRIIINQPPQSIGICSINAEDVEKVRPNWIKL